MTKAETIRRQLRDEILSGDIAPGNRLDQRELAKRFSMSPTPIREALRQLQSEGVLAYSANQGVTVAEVTASNVADLREVYLMRSLLEPLAARLAHGLISRVQLEEIERIHDSFRKAHEAGDGEATRALNYTFHMRIYKIADAPRLLRFIEVLWGQFPWETLWLHHEKREGPVDDHAAILDALVSGTAAEAAERTAGHIRKGYDALCSHVRDENSENSA